VTRRRGRRRKKLLYDLGDRLLSSEGGSYRSHWRNCFGRGFGPVVLQITDDEVTSVIRPIL
jgi:hypothetical protein